MYIYVNIYVKLCNFSVGEISGLKFSNLHN